MASLAAACMLMVGMVAFAPAAQAVNPYLPEWEHVPDGEPYVFADPDTGEQRVYVYGSHDTLKNDYCGKDLVVWSAPVDDLTDWRYDGVIFESKTNRDGEPFAEADTLFAPDVTTTVENGKTVWWLYPNNQAKDRKGMVARSDSPTGPFVVSNWSEDDPNKTVGTMRFDPAVFVDDDGRVYGYWGFHSSNAAELDPTTMATVKPGTQVVYNMVDQSSDPNGTFRFFEASSMRKIDGMYVFIYSRKTLPGENGLNEANSTLAYAYGTSPLGPWTYGGTLVDTRAPETGENGERIASNRSGNTHGSLVQINGQWYLFYHRCVSGLYARQGTAEKVDVQVKDGKVEIK